MDGVCLTIGAHNITIPEYFHGFTGNAGRGQISPGITGKITILVNGEADMIAVQDEQITARTVIISGQDHSFKDKVGEAGLCGVLILREALLHLQDTRNDIKQGFRSDANIRFTASAGTDFD